MNFLKKHYHSAVFILLLLCVSSLYRYGDIVFKKPQSIHRWRQADCASLAWNYYQYGMHFFKPEVSNLTSDGGTSGKCAPSEVPVLYYCSALLYKIFGFHDFIFRLLNTILFLGGLFFLFKLLFFLLDDFFWAASITLLLFTSPVLAYYGNNFLSDTPALACALAGWYYMMRFLSDHKQKWFFISIILFFFAGAFKVTALMSLVAISGLLIVEIFRKDAPGASARIFPNPIRLIIAIMAVFTGIGLWIFYADYYNTCHTCNYFSTTIFPVWKLSPEEIHDILRIIRESWLNQYFHKSVILLTTLCFVFTILTYRKTKRFLYVLVLFLFAGSVLYFLLQFWTFRDHDYYTVNLFILPVIIYVAFFDLLKREHYRIFQSLFIKVIFAVFLVFNLLYAKNRLSERYSPPQNNYLGDKDLYSVEPYLTGFGLKPEDKIISIPDGSHCSLYILNHRGWTEYVDAGFNRGSKVYYNNDSAAVQASINKGAKFLIVNGVEELYRKPYLSSFTTNLAGRFNKILIFRLDKKENNFSLPVRTARKTLFCDAETLSSDNQYFLNNSDKTSFNNGKTSSSEFAHSGHYSCKTDKDNPYGMTINLDSLRFGESIVISVWQKTTCKYGGIVASAESSTGFYNADYKVVENGQQGWKKISNEFFIPQTIDNKGLKIYLYNPSECPSYYDDLKIVLYKKVQ